MRGEGFPGTMKKASKEAVRALLAKASKGSIRVDDTLEVVIGGTPEDVEAELDKKEAKALKAGSTVTRKGVTKWIEDSADIKPGAEGGSAMFHWDEAGNRIRYTRTLCTRTPDGKLTKKVLRRVWKSY